MVRNYEEVDVMISDYFVESGTPEVVVTNFLKGVASSTRYMDLNSETDSSKSCLKGGGKTSMVDLTEDDAPVSDEVKPSCASSTSEQKVPAKVPAVISLLKTDINTDSQKNFNLKKDENTAQIHIAHTEDEVGDNLTEKDKIVNEIGHGDTLSASKVCDTSRQSIEKSPDGDADVKAIDITEVKNSQSAENGAHVNKNDSQNNQSHGDNQSKDIKNPVNQSDKASSQTENQSDKIVLLDSAVLENSAAKINHSELLILDDAAESAEKAEVHHLDDILDEWSAEICSQ